MNQRFCAHCGKALDAGTRFCKYCGGEQPAQPPVEAQHGFTQPLPAPRAKKKWPLFAGIGAGVVVVAAVVLFLTGVIKLGGAAPAFAATDINGDWSGTISLDAVNGSGSQADYLRSQIGQTQPMDFQLTLDQNGKGTAVSDGQSLSAELKGTSLTISGQIDESSFNATCELSKNGAGYSMSGNYSASQSGIGFSGKMTMQRGSGQTTAVPTVTPATMTMTPTMPSPTAAVTPATSTQPPDSTTLNGTYQYMYDQDNSYAAGIEFHQDGTCALYDTGDDSRIPSTYVISGDTLNLTLYPVDSETEYQTYKIAIGTGKITLTDPSTGESFDFVQVE